MFRKLHPNAGARPGTLMIPANARPTRIHIVQYDKSTLKERRAGDAESLADALATDKMLWVHVQGLKDVDLLLQIAEHFRIHPLSLEDIVNVPQRPKQEVADTYVLAIMRSMTGSKPSLFETEQLTLVLGRGFVLSFQESYHPLFEPVLERLQNPDARLRKLGSDYLAYALLDTTVDHYFPVIEALGERLEALESQVLAAPRPGHLKEITLIKRQLIKLRRVTWAQRELVGELLHERGSLASDQVIAFTRDTFDHCVQIAEVVDMYRETATGLVNTYLSSVGQHTNEIMKTLTIVGSIFIPLTFLAGIYGMNFEHMPELQSRWAYPTIWSLMLAIAVGMIIYFYRCGWIGGQSYSREVREAIQQVESNVASVQADDWDQQPTTRVTPRRRAA